MSGRVGSCSIWRPWHRRCHRNTKMQTVGACACALKVVVVEIKMRILRSFGEWRNDNNCSYHREQSSIHYYIIHRSLGRVVPWSAPLDSTRRRRFTVVSLLCCGVSRYGRTTPDHNKSPPLPVPTWSCVYTRRGVINHQPTYIQDPTVFLPF